MRYLIFVCCLLIVFSTHAQEQLGLRTDNYSGIHGSLLNPSHNVTSLFRWDINLISAGVSAQTNYGFIRNTNVFHAIRNSDNLILEQDIENTTTIGPNDLVADFNDNKRLKYVSVLANVMGPSLMVQLKNGHSFGFFTNVRSAVSSHDIPTILNYSTFFDTPFSEFVSVDAFKISTMVWSEFGLNYAAKVETNDGYFGLGANLKFINGYEAAYINVKRSVLSAQIQGDTMLFQSPHLNYGVTNSNLEGENPNLKSNGFGVGVDLGFTYVYEGNEDHYKWKVGVSLLDLGQIELSRNAEEHDLNTDTLVVFPSKQFQSISNQDRIYLLSEIGLADSTASLTHSSFRMGLPGAISIQADYKIIEYFYVNGVFVQRIPMGVNSIRRNNLMAVTPRFEHRWFGFSMPVVLLNYQKLSLGTSLRLAFLTIGSDDVGSFFGKNDLDSTDFYIALKVNPFNLGLNLGGRKRGKNVKCYQF
ncbi:MAG: DUF5723 family protein [Saprospiraceae bacterium]